MGKAVRWLKALFSGSSGRRKDSTHDPTPEKKKGWSFSVRKGYSYREKPKSNVVVEEEESKRAIAVAEATAAVAEAAVAAAEAAAAVVRLTSRGRTCVGRHERRSEVWAAVKIQSAFRGYLARRALKALKGLVKIQALVRGYIVRKQAVEALRCMQALVRAQARVRASRVLQDAQPPDKTSEQRHCHDPPKQEKKEPSSRANATKTERPRTLKVYVIGMVFEFGLVILSCIVMFLYCAVVRWQRNGSRVKKHGGVSERVIRSPDWKWLDRWMDERCCDCQNDDKEKILEVDAGGTQINPKWRNRHQSMCFSNQNRNNLAAMPESPSDSTTAQRSVLSSSSVEMRQHSSSPLGFPQEGDSFYSTCSRLGGGTKSGPFTPSKSECSWSYLSGFSEYPSYMSNTESSRAKARSLSAPRQRLEYESFGSIKRDQVHGYGMVSQPFSSSRRASSLQLKFAEKAYPGSGRLDRMGVSTKI